MRIVIIGAGLLGVSTAYFLNRQGCTVTVLDRRTGPGLETSYANGGMITPSQADPWNSPGIVGKLLRIAGTEASPIRFRLLSLLSSLRWGRLFFGNASPERFMANLKKNGVLANYNLKILRTLRNETGIFYDGSSQGTMKVYRDRRAFERAVSLSETLKTLDVNYDFLEPERVLEKEPALAGSIQTIEGGIYYPDDEAGDAHKFCTALAGIAAKAGVSFRYNVDIRALETDAGGLIHAARSSNDSYVADAFVLAAGSYSIFLAKPLGLSVPIRPVKGYSLTLQLENWRTRPRIPVIDDARHIALTPLGNRLRIAGMAELFGFDTRIYSDRINKLLSFAEHIYPAIGEYLDGSAIREWTGLRPYSGDGVPILGKTAIKNLYLNTGHGHLGWSMAVGSGKLVADHICAEETGIDIAPYQLQRF